MTLRLRADGLNWRQIDDEVVVLDSSSAKYLAINGSGARLWPALVAGATLEELAAILVESYGIDRSHAAADATRFLAALEEQGLLAA
jgi:Coenzyme PQQ synthesis protein D (PqqD)